MGRCAPPASSKSGSEGCDNEGQAQPDHPAPTLALTASDEIGGSDTALTTQAASESDSGTSGLGVTALIVAIVGLLAGIAGAGARLHVVLRPEAFRAAAPGLLVGLGADAT